MTEAYQRVTVIGGTSWGTTLALLLSRTGRDVTMLLRTEEETRDYLLRRGNPRLLPGVALPLSVAFTCEPQEALDGCDLAVLAVPAQRMRDNVRRIAGSLPGRAPLLSAAKGLELDTHLRMTEVLQQEADATDVLVLSGPNLAPELAAGLPGSTVIACASEEVRARAQATFTSGQFRIYTTSDVIGVELAGALKNVIALCAGMADGMGNGANGKAAFLTRGLVEIARLGRAAGADTRTFSGLAGLGDLVATCFSPLSRNRYVGEQIGQGRSLEEALRTIDHVAEGVATTRAACQMARDLGIEMPITQQAYRVLFEGLAPGQALAELMARQPRYEADDALSVL